MKRILAAIIAASLLTGSALSLKAWDGAGWDTSITATGETGTYTGNKTIDGNAHVTGSVLIDGISTMTGVATLTGGAIVGETLGDELLTLTCAGVGLSAPVGAWSCADDTITRTASGSNLTLAIGPAVTAGGLYKASVTYATITASTFSLTVGGTVQSTHSAAGTFAEYFSTGTTGAPTITVTATSAGTITLSTLSMKLRSNAIAPAAGPMSVAKTLANATAKEAAMTVTSIQSGAGGDKTALRINLVGSGTGNEYPIEAYADGTQIFNVSAAGTISSVNGIVSTSGPAALQRYASTRTGSGTIPAYDHTGTQTTWGSIYKDSGTVGAMDGNDTLNIFDAAITNSNHTNGTNQVNAFNAGNITGDAEATESVVNAGTGWDYIINSANYQVQANGKVITGAATEDMAWTKSGFTSAAATDLITVTVPSNTSIAGEVKYGLYFIGTGETGAHGGAVYFVCTNKAGTITKAIKEAYPTPADTTITTGSKTLTDDWTMKTGDVCTIQVAITTNATSPTISATGKVLVYGTNTITLN